MTDLLLLLLDDRWVVEHLTLRGSGENAEIFDVAAAEDNAFIYQVVCGDLLAGVFLATFTAHALNLLERDSRRVAVDRLENADISRCSRPLTEGIKSNGCVRTCLPDV
jgi:hypothetical protein